MSGYKSFAVAGAGQIGAAITKELLRLKSTGVISTVFILSRSIGGYDELIAQGAEVKAVDYESPSSLAYALTGVDVVISAVGFAGLAKQVNIVTGAKQAGVQLFVPSEFGNNNTDGERRGPLGTKQDVRDKAKEVGLAYAAFYTGIFTEYIFSERLLPVIGFDFSGGKINVAGSGDAPISFTTILDIVSYVGYVLTSLPKERIENRTFRIEGSKDSWNDLLAGYQSRTGKMLTVTYRKREELEERVKNNPGDLFTYILLDWDLGRGVVGTPLDNNEFPDWNPKKALDVLVSLWG